MSSDLEMLLNPDEDYSAPQSRQALADALRKKQRYGAIGQLMGVAPTAQVGAGLQDQAQGSLKSALAKQQAAERQRRVPRSASRRRRTGKPRWSATTHAMQSSVVSSASARRGRVATLKANGPPRLPIK